MANPARSEGEVLGEQVLEREKSLSDGRKRLVAVLNAANIAFPALYRIAATGNVQAKEAAKQIHAILNAT